ncbi:Uu.00g130030.m01.CDS01 [Anthostomella pinea]|uniref:Uu.00g130030.m01.CDS01 n=1 Tax=Anthostomella pinea TaxID=933095 RepID=A0AAI8YI44_9PEZI|nr:Uu.00g130030.m01.CDS01 [Anthostomella pinea]
MALYSNLTHPVNDIWSCPELSGILAGLYDAAKTSRRERPSSTFWRAYFGRALPLDEFEAVAEENPDSSGRSVDVFINRYLPHTHEIRLQCPVEVKRDNGNIEEAEQQAQDACYRAMRRHKLSHMFAITTDATRFRCWMVEKGKKTPYFPLTPIDGGEARLGHRKSYIEIHSDQGEGVMKSFLEQLYNNRPLVATQTSQTREAPLQPAGQQYGESTVPSYQQQYYDAEIQFYDQIKSITFEPHCFHFGHGVSVHNCFSRYCQFFRHHGRRIPHFHPGCYEFATRTQGPSLDEHFLAATDYSFEPSWAQESRRRKFLRRFCVETLRNPRSEFRWPEELPTELWSKIASFVVSELATALDDFKWATRGAVHEAVDLSAKVYAQYVAIDGIVYLQGLSNEQLPGAFLRFDYDRTTKLPVHVDVGSDHLGVTCFRFVLPNDRPGDRVVPTPGLWWKRISRADGIHSLRIQSDGLKVVKLQCDTGPTSSPLRSQSRMQDTISSVRWSVPGIQADVALLDLATCGPVSGDLSSLRMQHIWCNSPAVKGYSARCSHYSVSRLLCHIENEDPGKVYQQADSNQDDHDVWIYLPIDEGERTQTISWRTTANQTPGTDVDLALFFSTDREKAVLFGWHVPPPDVHQCDFYQVRHLPNAASRLYLNVPESTPKPEIYIIGLENALDYRRIPYPRPLVPLSPQPDIDQPLRWYHSSCLLDDVRTITAYRPHVWSPILGILVRYNNDHSMAVGQVRLDWLQETYCVHGDNSKAFLGIGVIDVANPDRGTAEQYSVITNIGVDPDHATSRSTVALVLEGSLDWWFTSHFYCIRQCKGGKFWRICDRLDNFQSRITG